MIDKALTTLTEAIQDFLLRLPELNLGNQKAIRLSHVVKADGSLAIPDNTLGLTLVNVEEERITRSQQGTAVAGGRVQQINPAVKLNLYVLVCANFKDYKTGLELLSGVIRFFQARGPLTPQNTPTLDPGIAKLTAELHSLTFEQQNNLWGALGAKYLPSVLYRLRLVTIQEGQAAAETEPITTIAISGRGR